MEENHEILRVEFEEIGSVYEVKSCKIVFLGGTSYSLVQTLALGCIV